jgi:antirestriction protein
MNTKETLNKVRTLLGMEVKLEQMTLDNGAVLEAEVFEQGAEVFVVADEERVPAPVGEHKAEGDVVIVIEEEGVISEIKKAESEEEEAPAQAEEVVEEEMSTEAATPKKVVESVSKETFFSEIEKLRNEINELKLSKVEVKEVEEVSVELSSDEDVKGITHTPENKPQERELHLFSQNRKQTLKDRIFKTLNK